MTKQGVLPPQGLPLIARQPWDQMAGEPDRWYGRFQVYLELGVTRTIIEAVNALAKDECRAPVGRRGLWYVHARQWYWRERAHAWDVYQRELLALSERNTRIALRSRRLARMEDYLDDICEVLDNAHMADANEQLAREWLPQMRVFLRDLLVAERQEFEHGDYERNDPNCDLVITADDLRAAQRELEARMGMPLGAAMTAAGEAQGEATENPVAERWAERWARSQATVGVESYEAQARRKHIAQPRVFVCAGADKGLTVDLAVLRAVRAATGLQFRRVLNATRSKFAATLRRERGLGGPVELLHLALPASPAGVEFEDGIADGNWLSERLLGVRVLVLASCESDNLGDWLDVVPHVITFRSAITHEDAGVLTRHFWHNIGRNLDPGAALDEALTHCPPAVSEYVVRHW